ncbi:hypothetical protein CLV58_109117 [Spirosoma oryzae]|uniref:Uncharacterized protein n=1 Tax=Spirosoma oryzae TaxID=1469603 RepID=A0A2T0SYB8_9BACT|nr:hypothetical protein [Spirosoma oryzae]PRY38390.1 hypothetical protein CLV58_109117 [Spirosoma oryzae]
MNLFPLPDWADKTVSVDKRDEINQALDLMTEAYVDWFPTDNENATYLAYRMLKALEADGYQLTRIQSDEETYVYSVLITNTYLGRDDTNYDLIRYSLSKRHLIDWLLEEAAVEFTSEEIWEAVMGEKSIEPKHGWGGYGIKFDKIKVS